MQHFIIYLDQIASQHASWLAEFIKNGSELNALEVAKSNLETLLASSTRDKSILRTELDSQIVISMKLQQYFDVRQLQTVFVDTVRTTSLTDLISKRSFLHAEYSLKDVKRFLRNGRFKYDDSKWCLSLWNS